MREGRWQRTRSLVSVIVVAVVTSGCVSIDESSTGEQVYDQVCSRCHGAQLEGGIGPALGAGTDAAGRDDQFWTQIISRGFGRMPSFRSTLSEEQILRVIEFARQEQGQ